MSRGAAIHRAISPSISLVFPVANGDCFYTCLTQALSSTVPALRAIVSEAITV